MRHRRQHLVLVSLWGLALAAPAWAEAPKSPALSSVGSRELWSKGSDQAMAGDFDAAIATLTRLRGEYPADPVLGDALRWMDEASRLSASRERLRSRLYDKYVLKAKAAEDEAKWSDALGLAYTAFQNAPDKDAFRREAWLKPIVDASLKKAAEDREKGEWRDALLTYEVLRLIFEQNEEYKQAARLCRQRAHFEAFYTSKNEWKNDLRNIEADAVRQVLVRMSEEYVREVDFKQISVSALENVVILAHTAKLSTVFPSLADKDKVTNFATRIESLIQRVRGRTRFDHRDAHNLFNNVLAINRETIDLPENVIVEEFVSGMIEPLDEFTSVIWPSEVDDFAKHTRGEFVGVGIQINKDEPTGFIRVESPLEDGPAYEAGVSPGDLITKVDGRPTVDIDVDEVVRIISGEPGTSVTLTMKSGELPEFDLKLKRRVIKLQTVRGVTRSESGKWDFIIDKEHRIGYVRVASFMERTVVELRQALSDLQQAGARGLILDLRFNPGGLLRSAVDVCNLFLPEDAAIVKTIGRNGRSDDETTASSGIAFRDVPIIILINEYSASASEIVAGALSGHGKAFIIGSRSYGKGSVQRLIPIEDNLAYLKLTTDHYYIPTSSGGRESEWRCLHREDDSKMWGVEPDVVVDLIPQETRKVLQLRRRVEVLKGKGKSAVPEDFFKRRPSTNPADEDDVSDAELDDMPDTDPQLLTATQVMRMKLLSNQPWTFGPRVAEGATIEATPAR